MDQRVRITDTAHGTGPRSRLLSQVNTRTLPRDGFLDGITAFSALSCKMPCGNVNKGVVSHDGTLGLSTDKIVVASESDSDAHSRTGQRAQARPK